MNKKLYKSKTNKVIAGVCGGLENYFAIDATIIRLAWAVISVITGILPGILAYIVAALIIPEEPGFYTNNPKNPYASTDSKENNQENKQ